MAKTTIYCECGAPIVVVGRNRRDADAQARKLAGTAQCDACRRRAFDKKNAEALAASAGLPPLGGTARQVPWAASIRLELLPLFDTVPAAMLEGMVEEIAEFMAPECLDAARLELADALALIVTEFRATTDAEWWIENRNAASDHGVEWLIRKELERREETLTPTVWNARREFLAAVR